MHRSVHKIRKMGSKNALKIKVERNFQCRQSKKTSSAEKQFPIVLLSAWEEIRQENRSGKQQLGDHPKGQRHQKQENWRSKRRDDGSCLSPKKNPLLPCLHLSPNSARMHDPESHVRALSSMNSASATFSRSALICFASAKMSEQPS